MADNGTYTWIHCDEPREDASVRVFAFAHAGGSTAMYADWGAEIGPDVEVHRVELPGHGARRRPEEGHVRWPLPGESRGRLR